MKNDPRPPSEYQIQCGLVKLIERWVSPNVCWFAVPNQSNSGPIRGHHLKRMGVKAGVSDLIFMRPEGSLTRVLCVELKAKNGTWSDSQKAFKPKAEAANAEYVVMDNEEEVLALLYARGMLTRNLAR